MDGKYSGVGLHWALLGRNKKGIACDLRRPEGQNIVRDLAAQSDVLVENFRPGMMERWNSSYERLDELNPRLIMARISAYGSDRPVS